MRLHGKKLQNATNRYDTYSHQYHSKATMNGDTTSTNISRESSIGSFNNEVNNTEENASRKSSIGIFSIVSIDNNAEENTCRKSSVGSSSNVSLANDREENTCRKSSVGSFKNVSLANDTEEEILQGTIMLDIFFTPTLIYNIF